MRNCKFSIFNFKFARLLAVTRSALSAVALLLMTLTFTPSVLAGAAQQPTSGGGVNACADSALRNALAGGGTVTFSVAGPCIISVTSPLLITSPTTIDGGGASITLSGSGVRRVITTTAGVGTLTLANITVQNGAATDDGGGGLYVRGNLVLTNVNLLSSTSNFDGGAVYATGTVTITGGFVQNNAANVSSGQGGGIFTLGPMYLTGTLLANNVAGTGGGAYASGSTTVARSTFQLNQANDNARGGGGIYAGDALTLAGDSFEQNSGGSGGGALAVGPIAADNTQFVGNHATSTNVDAGGGGLNAQSALALTGSLFISNTSAAIGGGAYALGAAIVERSTFRANSAGSVMDGGGLTADGGAVVSSTLFARNRASTGGALSLGFLGSTTSRIVNVFMTGNSATGGQGSAIFLSSGNNTLSVLFSTISSPTISAGSAIRIGNGTAGITDTIIASSTIGIERAGGSVYEDYNVFSSVTIPISGGVTSGAHHPGGSAALVDTLVADTYQLGAASAAIDTGTAAGANRDYFGSPRPQGGGFDIGAAESSFAVDLALAKRAAPAIAAPGERVTYTLAYSNAGSGGIAYGVRITDQIPFSLTNLSFISSGAAVTATGAISYAWQVADMPAGSGGLITVSGIVSPGISVLPALLTNTATITTTSVDIAPANNRSSAAIDIDGPITGLSATNNGPTLFGNSTTLTATVTSGTNINYQWNFGDGSATASGAVITHTFARVGTFSATVTATNTYNTAVKTTTVVITGYTLDLPLVVR